MPTRATPPVPESAVRANGRTGPRLALLALAMLVVAVDFNIVYVALPRIGHDLDLAAGSLQWVVSAYAVGYGGFLLLGGRLVDRLGPRRMFVASLFAYAVASLGGGLARTAGLLVAARFVQGVGGAVLFPATLALIHTTFREGPERDRAMAAWGTASASGLIVGAAAGGLLTSSLGWPWVFYVNVPLALAAAAAAPVLFARDRVTRSGGRIDVPGGLLGSAAATLLVLGLVSGPAVGWASPRGAGSLAAGLVLLAAFLLVERRAADPLVPPRLLGRSGLVTAMALMVVFMTAINGLHYVYFVHLQDGLGLDALRAGLAFLPVSLGGAAGSGRLLPVVLRRSGPRTALLLGLAGIGVAMALMAPFLSAGGSFWPLVPGTLLWGLSAGLAFPASFLLGGTGAAPDEQGVASALVSTAQQVGGALGLAVLLAVAATASDGASPGGPAALVDGLRRATWVGAAVAVLGVLLAVLATGLSRNGVRQADHTR